jgi:4-hydroxybenzoate polyprenyltransferase
VRAPLALTAVADGLTGTFLATVRLARAVKPGEYPDQIPHEPVLVRAAVCAGLASAALYLAGMALNDYFDRERDRTLAPSRPIPSGRIAPWLALGIGLALLSSGVGAAFAGGGGRAAAAAAAVASGVLAYDAVLKRWRIPGALGMAFCRAANVILGAFVGLAHGLGAEGATTLPQKHALAIGTYVFSLTLLSTFEDADAPRSGVVLGFVGAAAAPIALLVVLPQDLRIDAAPFTTAHLIVIAFLAARALNQGTKATGHATTRNLIRGLFLLDGAALAGAGVLDLTRAALFLALFFVYYAGAKLLFRRPAPPVVVPVPDAGQL